MESRRRTRSQGPPSPTENNELIQWDPLQDPVRIEREQVETHRLAKQRNTVISIATNRVESSEIPQEQQEKESDHQQTPTSGEISPKQQKSESITLQSGEISPNQQNSESITLESGEISPNQRNPESTTLQSSEILPKLQQKGGTILSTPNAGEMSQQGIHRVMTSDPNIAGEGVIVDFNGRQGQRDLLQVDTGEHYLDDNFSDVMQSSAIGSNISSLFNTTAFNTTNNEQKVTLDWVIPDDRNSRLETLQDKHIMDFPAPGGKTGAMLVYLLDLEPFYDTKEFLVDLQ